MKEIVLPSGKFARIETPLRGRQLIQAQSTKNQDIIATLVSIAITIDDKRLTYDEVLNLDIRDYIAIQKLVTDEIGGPIEL